MDVQKLAGNALTLISNGVTSEYWLGLAYIVMMLKILDEGDDYTHLEALKDNPACNEKREIAIEILSRLSRIDEKK